MNPASVLDCIGNTPLVPLRRMIEPGMASVLLKMEAWNPSGSLKDRIVKTILEHAIADGRLKPHHIIIDASSGNTGIALGMIARVLGYRSRIFMPDTKSIERRKIMKAWGTEVVLTSGDDQNSHIWAAEEAARDTETYFYLNQNGDPGNWLAHYHGTGAELVAQSSGRIDSFVAGVGTGGLLMGVSRRLADAGLTTRIVAVEPAEARSRIEGLLHFDGSYTPPIWEPERVHARVRVSDDDAFATARRLMREEGIFCGPSAGATLHVALEEARRLGDGRVVVAAACDRGERYLSTRLMEDC